MNHSPSSLVLYDVDLEDEKEQARNTETGGYHDWEAGAPHDPNHRALPPRMPTTPFRRRRVDISLWHLMALYFSVFFLAAFLIVFVALALPRLHSAANKTSPGMPLTFNPSASSTVSSSINESLLTTAALTTRTVDNTSTVSPSTTMLTTSSNRRTTTKVVFYTPPPVTVTTWVNAR